MRALRVVGLTEDGEVVLEDPVRLERFRVPADERLRAAARGDLSRLGQIAIELESQLRPREIQARIRAGASVEQVAAAAGVPEQKIERFAYPVLLERFRTAEIAQRAHPVRADGPDNRMLADVVAHTFGLRGQAYEGARWDSWKGEDGRWVVALDWRAGRSHNRAHWTFQPGAHGGTVTALDENAADLVEGLPLRPLRTVGAVVDMNRPEEEPPPAPAPVEQWRAAASDGYREPGRPAPERTVTERTVTERSMPDRTAPDRSTDRTTDRSTPDRPTDRTTDRSTPDRPMPDRSTTDRSVTDRTVTDRSMTDRTAERPLADRPTRTATEPRRPAPPAQRQAEPASPYRGGDARPAEPRESRGMSEWDRAAQRGVPASGRTEQAGRPDQAGRTEHDAVQRDAPARVPAAPPADSTVDVTPRTGVPAAVDAPESPRVPAAAEPPESPVPTDTPAAAGSDVPVRAEARGTADAPARTADRSPAPIDPAGAAGAPAGSTVPPSDAAPAAPATPAATADAPTVGVENVTEPATPAPPLPDEAVAATPEPAAAGPTDPAAAAPEAPARRTKKGKPVMPSWDEVLLGVRGPR